MTFSLPFENSYAKLPERFYAKLSATPASDPAFLAVNADLADALGLDPASLKTDDALAIFSGTEMPLGSDPLAQAYAGHQFGGWNPQLGDGRALLLGEILDPKGQRFDIQLKGSGRTPFSRSGDGRAWVGPVLREYVVSEAMHALGIPTTRALAAVTTGDPVIREAVLPGAVLTRVAASHIRVGTFQYFAARQDVDALQILFDHIRWRHYPQAETPLDLLSQVIARQARLIAQWMGVGFIHGVMNTDNSHVAGITIDYGPCAFMDSYHPKQVFSSIDQHGRYAYDNQPGIAAWNMAQLATALLPLMGDRDAAIEQATEAVHGFGPLFQAEWLTLFRAKLGFATQHAGDEDMIHDLLDLMAAQQADFTNTFRHLGTDKARDQFLNPEAFDPWHTKYRARIEADFKGDLDAANTQRRAANPAFIPRNHRIEEMITAAVQGDMAPFERLMNVLRHPFSDNADAGDLQNPPLASEIVHQTFCGT
ncbi:UNVERIFIED_CONTAM: hypothetical protein GTU68_022016 [Idotea baltica]|nr:hypothetical protein [Idotea baltica]